MGFNYAIGPNVSTSNFAQEKEEDTSFLSRNPVQPFVEFGKILFFFLFQKSSGSHLYMPQSVVYNLVNDDNPVYRQRVQDGCKYLTPPLISTCIFFFLSPLITINITLCSHPWVNEHLATL